MVRKYIWNKYKTNRKSTRIVEIKLAQLTTPYLAHDKSPVRFCHNCWCVKRTNFQCIDLWVLRTLKSLAKKRLPSLLMKTLMNFLAKFWCVCWSDGFGESLGKQLEHARAASAATAEPPIGPGTPATLAPARIRPQLGLINPLWVCFLGRNLRQVRFCYISMQLNCSCFSTSVLSWLTARDQFNLFHILEADGFVRKDKNLYFLQSTQMHLQWQLSNKLVTKTCKTLTWTNSHKTVTCHSRVPGQPDMFKWLSCLCFTIFTGIVTVLSVLR